MCTPNLHMLLCRLFDQETAHGCVDNLELWVERCIQYLKASLKFRITSLRVFQRSTDIAVASRLVQALQLQGKQTKGPAKQLQPQSSKI